MMRNLFFWGHSASRVRQFLLWSSDTFALFFFPHIEIKDLMSEMFCAVFIPVWPSVRYFRTCVLATPDIKVRKPVVTEECNNSTFGFIYFNGVAMTRLPKCSTPILMEVM
jgi:hypothetical protein